MNTALTQFPPPAISAESCVTGVFPVDFIFEIFFERGLKWFREEARAPDLVYAHLKNDYLKSRYGQSKIDEIAKYIRETEIDIFQSFPVDDMEAPAISLNLQGQEEIVQDAGLDDYSGSIDTLDTLGNIIDRQQRAYIPTRSQILVGIHATGSPDKVKYLYYLASYLLSAFKSDLQRIPGQENGLFNITFRASDLSRLNDFLPQNMFSRFMTVTAEHFDVVEREKDVMITDFEVNVDVNGG